MYKLFLIIFLLLVFGRALGDDNEIDIKQVSQGDDITLDITQIGYNNDIFFSVGDGDDVSVEIVQKGNNNEIGWANNIVNWGSGYGWVEI